MGEPLDMRIVSLCPSLTELVFDLGRGGDLLGYPVLKSVKAAAIGTGVKSVFFGNWSYMGFREAPGLTVLRDPYTLAATGQVRFIYAFRAVYEILQAGAIGYGLHA